MSFNQKGQTKKLLKFLKKIENPCCDCPDISQDEDNSIECRDDGLYSSASASGPTNETLIYDSTIVWDYDVSGPETNVTLLGNAALLINNLPAHVVYLNLVVTQDATGSRTLTLPVGTKVINGGAGIVTLSTAANAIDILSFRWDGTTLYCTEGTNYN